MDCLVLASKVLDLRLEHSACSFARTQALREFLNFLAELSHPAAELRFSSRAGKQRTRPCFPVLLQNLFGHAVDSSPVELSSAADQKIVGTLMPSASREPPTERVSNTHCTTVSHLLQLQSHLARLGKLVAEFTIQSLRNVVSELRDLIGRDF